MSHRLTFALGVVLSIGFSAGSAFALGQPDGTPIPQGNGLQGLFDSRGENINALGAASAVPETFLPACSLTFEVLQRNAGYQNAFGWYNVTGAPPSLSDLHEFIKCSDPLGTVVPLPNIKQDPAYLGGEIGFYEGVVTGGCTPQSGVGNYAYIFYSEKAWNPDGNQANPFIHLLIYDSTVTPNAFYFGWEDLISGGDNDFDDLTTLVTGITCSGGGGECQTGQPGVCADGTEQCQNGSLTCVPLVGASPESCDGFDNDCNGLVDDGDLCGADEVCSNGVCVARCGTGEFVCPPSLVCDTAKGVCVEPACNGISCEEGTKCVGGTCVNPCNGVVCPTGQACVAGTCLDPCDIITCDDSQVCQGGACIDKCACAGCAAGSQCQPTGLCLFDACVGNTCPPGTTCQSDGSCKDDCDGVVCPAGQICMTGECITDPNPGTGGAGGAGGGFVLSGGSGGGPSGSGGSNGGSNNGGSGGSGGSGGANTGDDGGCNCVTAGDPRAPSSAGLALGALGLAIAALRTRRQRCKR
ncbi:MAG: DUF4114 domain-containing protein [Polyangiaceae bacterium]